MTSVIVAVIAGMVIGGLLGGPRSGFSGALWGGGFGYLLFAIFHLRERLDGMQRDLEELRQRRREASPEQRREVAQPARIQAPPPAAPETVRRGSDIIDLVEPAEERFIAAGRESRPQGSTPPAYAPPRKTPPPAREPEAAEEPYPAWLKSLVSGENLLVKLGVVILFFGVSFLVKYAAQHGLFPLELRLAAAAMGGCALLATGWRLRNARPAYAQAIQGGGVGILYLTTFAAMRHYHLVPTGAGFALLVAVCLLAGALAVLQEAPSLAVLGSAGGFLAPELASIGSGSPVTLFSYYALLNAGIVGIAWFRAWRGLNLLGFVCTFIVSALWGSRFYHPAHFAAVEPFLVLFFLAYTAVPILFARRLPTGKEAYLDGTLVFGTPVVSFALQAGLVRGFEFGLAWSALLLGLFYITLALVLFRRSPVTLRPLCDAYLAFGVVFATLAIPLAFDGRWTAAAWSLEGAGLVWAGLRQERRLARGFGYLLLIGSGVAFLTEAAQPTGGWPVMNGFYLGCLLVSGAALLASFQLNRQSGKLDPWEAGLGIFLFVWGMAWWFGSGLYEIAEHTLADYSHGACLSFIALSCGACGWLRRRLVWALLDWPALALLPAMAAFTLFLFFSGAHHPAARGGYLAWPLAFAVWYAILKRNDDRQPSFLGPFHAAGLWLVAALAAWEVHWQIGFMLPGLATWALAAVGALPPLLALLIVRRGDDILWPVARHYPAYLGLGSGPLILFGWLWVIVVGLSDAGNPWPLPYLPFLNPLDGATLLILVAIAAWRLKVEHTLPGLAAELPRGVLTAGFAATVFLWLNAVLLRAIHHWAGVAFTPDALFASHLVQGAIAVFWSLAALAIMTAATRRSSRPIWLAGATLLGAVVAKLFLVDLANHGTVERIVSFVAVGVLLLVIGWFSPVPPRTGEGGAA